MTDCVEAAEAQKQTIEAVPIPFVNFQRRYKQYEQELNTASQRVLSSGGYILGKEVELFEQSIAEFLDCPYVLGVADGTNALILSLKALGIGPGDEVIIPANSFIASAGAVAMLGATPRFCDVADDLNAHAEHFEEAITPNTKALLPVHLTGRPANMTAINALADKHNLFVVEDAAQSIGASHQGKMTGTLGNVGCFSLHPLKNLHVYGDGGLITTTDKALYDKLQLLRNHGLKDRDTCVMWGTNSRLDAIQAAFGQVGLNHLDYWTNKRRQTAQQYISAFQYLPMRHVQEAPGDVPVYHNCVFLTQYRDELMSYLSSHHIESKVHYPVPLHLQPAAKSLGYQLGDMPNTERFAKEMISLPVYPELADAEVRRVIEVVQQFFQEKC